jgi:hypothetical protein
VVLSSVSATLYELAEKSVVVGGDAHHCTMKYSARQERQHIEGTNVRNCREVAWLHKGSVVRRHAVARERPSSAHEHCSRAETFRPGIHGQARAGTGTD